MRIRPHLDRNPTFKRPDWLPPDSGWPELDALREQHIRLLDQVAAAGHAAAEVQRQHEAEDKQRKDALTKSYRSGSGPVELPDPTPPEQRQSELAAATEQVEAALDALEEFIGQALATMRAHRDEWFDALDDQVAVGEQKRAEARRLVAEADAAAGEVHRMRLWVDRHTGGRLGPIPYAELAPLPAERLDRAARSIVADDLAGTRYVLPDDQPGIEVIL
ncbi:MAG TPA: hypothetical protein VFJ77_03820 [Gaiellaceae bacterium]|nr:hypothetical protein [Gaiellaceae bacterium]